MADISILIDECPVEAILAEDIMNDSGVVLLKAGTILTERKKEVILNYGVVNVVIKSVVTLSPIDIEEKTKDVENNINKRMRKCEMTNEMNKLKNVLTRHYCRDFM